MNERLCRKCLLSELGEEEAKSILTYRDRIRPCDRAADDVYQKRMETCRLCDRLLAGTCQACGCYVEIRGIAARSHCPQKKW
jgi:hypothetical protein